MASHLGAPLPPGALNKPAAAADNWAAPRTHRKRSRARLCPRPLPVSWATRRNDSGRSPGGDGDLETSSETHGSDPRGRGPVLRGLEAGIAARVREDQRDARVAALRDRSGVDPAFRVSRLAGH